MKKTASILLAGLLVFSLAGCSDSATNAESTTSVESVESVQTSETVESVAESTVETAETTESVEKAKEPAPVVSLKDIYAEHGLKVGTCLTTQMISKADTKQIVLDQFSSITMENDMKPDYIFNKEESIATGKLTVQFNNNMIKMLDFAKENGLAVRGHTLVWYSQTPEWIFHENFDTSKGLVGRDEMLSRMESLISQMFAQLTEAGYIDLFYAYDVVNEAWMEDGSMRDCNWKTTIGDDYLWYAFYYANKYAPETIDLYYNDYNEQFKTETLFNFVNTLVDEDGNYLIDGIGFQAHLYTQDDLNAYFKTVDRLSETGLKIQLTELDVSLGAWQNTLPSTDENFKVQGQFYYDLINGLFERIDAGTLNMDALTFWGFGDGQSWRKNACPLLYDFLLKPKYSYYGAAQMKELAGF